MLGGISQVIINFMSTYTEQMQTREAIVDTLVFVKAYEPRIYNINQLLKRIRLKLEMSEMVTIEPEIESRRPRYIHMKELENSSLIRLVFDTEDSKSKSKISKILSNIENVEFLNFTSFENEQNYIEVTTKENVRLLRIVLNLLKLVLKVKSENREEIDVMDPHDSVKISEIFEKSKVAFKPNLYRFNQFVDYFFNIIKLNIGFFVYEEDQQELVNMIIVFLNTNCEIFNRNMLKISSGISKVKNFLKELFNLILLIYVHPETREIFKSIPAKLLYKVVNHTSHFLGNLFNWTTST